MLIIDKLIHEYLFNYCKNRSLIVITHKTEHFSYFDKIFLMDQGKVVEYGDPKILLKNEQSRLFSYIKDNQA